MSGFVLLMLAAAVLPAAAAPPAPAVRPIDRQGYPGMVAAMKGHPLVVNMWATWCDPCREEFPDLVRLHRVMAPRGLEVAAISLDTASALDKDVIPFLTSHGATFRLYIKTAGGDEEFINTVDPNWSGALPATFVYDRDGRLVRSILGSTTYDQLQTIVTPLLPAEK